MMSSNTDSTRSSTPQALGSSSTMPLQSNKSHRPNPSHVQTAFHAQGPEAAPTSAISASTGASNSQHGSPIMSPGPTILTSNSSIQASPESMRPQDEVQGPSEDFQLPESIISPKSSITSLGPRVTGSPSAPSEAVFSTYTASITTTSITTNNNNGAVGTSKNIIRSLSSRASRRLSKGRRQSSAASSSRETSVGPCFWRRRSDSNSTAPPEYGLTDTDSGSEIVSIDDNYPYRQPYVHDPSQISPPRSASGSISSGSNTTVGPVTPLQLRKGTPLKKVSKKNRSKRIHLLYDPATNKMKWDASRPQKFLHVDEIREIRTGSDIQQYARDFGLSESEERSRWFTIIYSVPEKSKGKFLHLVADNEETYSVWVTFLEAMLKHRQEVMASLMTFDEKAIAQYWQTEMMKHNSEDQEELDITGVMRVCQNLHIYSSQSTLQSNFRLADARRIEKLNYDEFLEFVRLMRQRQEVHRLMQIHAARPNVGLTFDEFFEFLTEVQKEDVSAPKARETWESTFNRLVRKHRNDNTSATVSADELNTLSETAFTGFLSSRQFNLPTIDEQREFTLNRPMNEYFISSSHNTYLLGRQVAGQSSVEGYISALVRGCRCVEVDCWDGGDGQPLVVHGHTLTSSIGFLEVMNTINKYAFVKSKFPLWISLEVHCSPAQQAIMTKVIRDTFGEKLVTEPLDPDSSKLPSPSELMERILIKVKQPRMAARIETMSSDSLMGMGRKRGNSVGSPLARSATAESNAAATTQSLPQSPMMAPVNASRKFTSNGQKINTINEGQVQELLGNNSDSDSGSENGSTKALSNIIPELGKLGVYCAGLKFGGFEAPAAKKFNHIFSFMESSFAKNSKTKEDKMQLNLHNMRYLMRVYPDGSRLTSTNFDPLTYWRRGVQMAALNWQTFDMGMQVNQAMFEGGTDSSGYVLKPDELRDIQVLPNDAASAIAQGKKQRSVVSFGIEVVSAQQLMRPANLPANKSMDFYVDVDVFHANDKRNKKDKELELSHEPDSPLRQHTEVIRENGFNPMFSNGQFRFKVTTKHPELIFVRWSVRLSNDGDYNNSAKDKPPMASYTAKLSNLKNGYRTLPLLNHAGEQYLFSSLFCKIDIGDIETKFIDVPRPVQEGGSKLNRLGGIFGRNNTSPRSTIERSSMEKRSFESN